MDDREWADYARAIDPPHDAAARVRARLDRALADRATAPVGVDASPLPRAAAILVFAKSSVLTLGLAIGGLGVLHVGARVLADPPATPPVVASTPAPERVAPPRAVAPQPAAAAAALPVPVDLDAVPSVQHPSSSTPAPRAARVVTAPSPRESDALKEEVALIASARRAVAGGDRRAALSALDAHARSFPRGVFAEERDAIAATLHCAEPGADRAAIARAFADARPGSTHLARVRATCDESATDSAASSE